MMTEFQAEPSACIPDTRFQAFFGRWAVRRRILDRLTGSIQSFTGVAHVEPDRFVEEGRFDSGSGSFISRRGYRLSWQGGNLSVRFPGGPHFITLGADATQPVRHLCGTDIYCGRFFFRSPDHWAEFWQVTGPRKNYVSLAHYLRPGSGETVFAQPSFCHQVEFADG